MATIYLIRHGQASFGAEVYDKLSELGCRQADVVGHYLRDQGINLDAAYSGDLLRQTETAERVLASQPGDVTLQIDARFNEVRNDELVAHVLPLVSRGNPQLQRLLDKGLSNTKDYQKAIEATFNYWVSPDCQMPGIQSWAEYSGGVRDALRELVRSQGSGKTLAIFTSGGTIATLVAEVLGVGSEYAYRFYEPVLNCSLTQLFYSGDKVSLSYFNDCSFLQVLGRQADENLISYR